MAFDELSPEEAHRRLAEFHAIDVRAEHEFRGPLGRVPGSIRVALGELEARANELPRGRPLLLVCRSGGRSGKACEKLAALGIGPVVNLTGGMIAWNLAQLPVEQPDPADLRELRDLVAAWLAQVSSLDPGAVGLSVEAPSHAALERALERIEASLGGSSAPADLELSLASFRRWLAVL